MGRSEIKPLRAKDLTGEKFCRLTVLNFVGYDKYKATMWNCKCKCGNLKVIRGGSLTNGYTKSCGCWALEVSTRNGRALKTHGHSKLGKVSKEYRKWGGMIQRCEDSSDAKKWPQYGGRGITVCHRWRTSFENFLADMGTCPKGMSIDRIDNNKGYSPENCRWATASEQARNTRSNHLITYKGETKSLAEWAEIYELNYGTLSSRLNSKKGNWKISEALTASLYPKNVLHIYKNKSLTVRNWSKELKITSAALRSGILRKGSLQAYMESRK